MMDRDLAWGRAWAGQPQKCVHVTGETGSQTASEERPRGGSGFQGGPGSLCWWRQARALGTAALGATSDPGLRLSQLGRP